MRCVDHDFYLYVNSVIDLWFRCLFILVGWMNTINSNTKLSERDYWRTPRRLVTCIADLLHVQFVLDPCAEWEHAHGTICINEKEDGLSVNWQRKIFHNLDRLERCVNNPAVFVNPPFSQMDKWADKIIEESRKGLTVVLVHPDTPDTQVYQKIEDHAFMQLRPDRRINYIKPGEDKETSGVSFPSVISVFNAYPRECLQRVRFNYKKGGE